MRRLSFLILAGASSIVLLSQNAGATMSYGISATYNGKAIYFIDVLSDAWYGQSLQEAVAAGIVSGDKDARGNPKGIFRPADPVSGAEIIKLSLEAAGYDTADYAEDFMLECPGKTHWVQEYLRIAYAIGLVAAGDCSEYSFFDKPATRAEVATKIVNAFFLEESYSSERYYDDVPSGQWYEGAVTTLTKDGILSGDVDAQGRSLRRFRPRDPINRAEAVKIIMRAREKYGMPGMKAPHRDLSQGSRTSTRRSVSSEALEGVAVRYTSEGFSPRMFTAPIGSEIVFLNESTSPLWVASDPHPAHTGYTGFDVGRIMRQGESFRFTFDRSGSWSYHNHMNPSHQGMVIVE